MRLNEMNKILCVPNRMKGSAHHPSSSTVNSLQLKGWLYRQTPEMLDPDHKRPVQRQIKRREGWMGMKSRQKKLNSRLGPRARNGAGADVFSLRTPSSSSLRVDVRHPETHRGLIVSTPARFIGPRRSPARPAASAQRAAWATELEDGPGAPQGGCWSPESPARRAVLFEPRARPVWRQPPPPLTGAAQRAPGAVPGAAGRARPGACSFPSSASEKREPGRGLGDAGGLEPRSFQRETLQAPRPGFGDGSSPPQQVREEEAAPESRGQKASAAAVASFPRAGLKSLGTPGFCCCARRRRHNRHRRGDPGGGAAGEGGGKAGGGGGGGGERRSRGWRMEPRAAAAGEPEPAAASSSFQARLWKNLQLGVGRSKGGGGGRAGGPERRTADTPSPSPPPPVGTRDAPAGGSGAGSRWSGFKKRKQVLDRVFSSSQPNLCCSSPEPLEPRGTGRAEQGSTLRRRIREHLLPAGKGPAVATGAAGGTPPGGRSPDSAPSSSSASSSLSSSPQPPPRGDRARDEGERRQGPGAHLCHQKSSSLPGTACLEQLLEPPPPSAEPARSPVESRAPETGEERGSSQVSASGRGR
ncbi:hypothetical protein H8959_021038 [Pygathrix nigripes]